MRRLTFLISSLAFLAPAYGQAPASAPASTPAPTAAPSGDESLKFESNEKLSDKDKVSHSAAIIAKMRDTLKVVLQKLTEAREAKDVVRLNCVNEKLTQIKGFIKIGEQADLGLQEAVAKTDSGAADHEFTKVEIAGQRVAQLRADAEACIGEIAWNGTEGQTKVDVTEPADLPVASTSPAPPSPPSVVVPPPASASTQP
ncbi:MAG: hypothetical protein JST54_08750 [Deltaproteobacteria bacterium]|nr:hypothetical protein [Deltaproteobacteria bacterium]